MNTTFEVGQLVILQNSTAFPEYDGWLAVVVEKGRECWATNIITMEKELGYFYLAKVLMDEPDFPDCRRQFSCRPSQLRPLGDAQRSLEIEKAEELETTI